MNMVRLCSFLGGSHAYGLNTPDSDIDKRGVFMNTDPAYILGTKRFDEERRINETEDVVYKELSHFLRLLKQANTEAIEILFLPLNSFLEFSPIIGELIANRHKLIDPTRLFACLCGYMHGERKLALGERRGKMGGKRWAAVQKYGFSPKNFVQLIRLAHAGTHFFGVEGFFPVELSEHQGLRDTLLDIKTRPEEWRKSDLIHFADTWEKDMKQAFDAKKSPISYVFDEEYVNDFLRRIYLPYLTR